MGIMSLVARRSECAAYSVDYPPTQWEMQCAGGSDCA